MEWGSILVIVGPLVGVFIALGIGELVIAALHGDEDRNG